MTETKIDYTVNHLEFLPKHYQVSIRKDRVMGGGGVMIAHKDSLCVTEATVPSTGAEMVWAKVEMYRGAPMTIGAYYQPPSNRTVSAIEVINTVLTSMNTDNHTILGGDFNAGDIDWETNMIRAGSDRKSLWESLISTLDEHHMEQLQREPTRMGAVLDLFCNNRPSLVSNLSTVPGISDHDIIVVDTNVKAKAAKKPPRHIRKWEAIQLETETFQEEFQLQYLKAACQGNDPEICTQQTLQQQKLSPTLTNVQGEAPKRIKITYGGHIGHIKTKPTRH
jgi:hypothetical protein